MHECCSKGAAMAMQAYSNFPMAHARLSQERHFQCKVVAMLRCCLLSLRLIVRHPEPVYMQGWGVAFFCKSLHKPPGLPLYSTVILSLQTLTTSHLSFSLRSSQHVCSINTRFSLFASAKIKPFNAFCPIFIYGNI